MGEDGAKAAAHAAAEQDPGVTVEEPLGPECLGVGRVQGRVVWDEQDRGRWCVIASPWKGGNTSLRMRM
jgi:hypothetical protein